MFLRSGSHLRDFVILLDRVTLLLNIENDALGNHRFCQIGIRKRYTGDDLTHEFRYAGTKPNNQWRT